MEQQGLRSSNTQRKTRSRRGKARRNRNRVVTKEEVIAAITKPVTQEQKQTCILLPGILTNVSSNASSTIAVSYTLNPDADAASMTSLAQVFAEYRVEWIKIVITPLTLLGGYTSFYFTESNEGTPTASTMQEKMTDAYVNTATACQIRRFEGTQSPHYIKKWKPGSIEENEYQLTNSSYQRVYLAAYASPSTHGAISASTVYWSIRAWYYISFRGRK